MLQSSKSKICVVYMRVNVRARLKSPTAPLFVFSREADEYNNLRARQDMAKVMNGGIVRKERYFGIQEES